MGKGYNHFYIIAQFWHHVQPLCLGFALQLMLQQGVILILSCDVGIASTITMYLQWAMMGLDSGKDPTECKHIESPPPSSSSEEKHISYLTAATAEGGKKSRTLKALAAFHV